MHEYEGATANMREVAPTAMLVEDIRSSGTMFQLMILAWWMFVLQEEAHVPAET